MYIYTRSDSLTVTCSHQTWKPSARGRSLPSVLQLTFRRYIYVCISINRYIYIHFVYASGYPISFFLLFPGMEAISEGKVSI